MGSWVCGAGSVSDDGVLRLGWASDDSGQGLRGWRVVRACRQDGSVCAYLGFGEVCGGRGMWSGASASVDA